eukprot:COSAG03_NODE_2_length_28887_cov_60.449825_24_plen_63_part_00
MKRKHATEVAVQCKNKWNSATDVAVRRWWRKLSRSGVEIEDQCTECSVIERTVAPFATPAAE